MRKLWLVVMLLWTAMTAVSAQTFTATVSPADKAWVYADAGLAVGTNVWVGVIPGLGGTGLSLIDPWGKFSSYSASGGLPTIGGDLNKYGWAMQARVTAFDTTTRTVTFAGTFYLLAPGYGFDDVVTEYLEKATFTNLTATFDSSLSQATVRGYMYAEVGNRQPTNESSQQWPVPVDWSAANPGYFSGVLEVVRRQPTDLDKHVGYLYGTLSAPIPDASTVMLFGSGLLPVLAVFRRRK